MKVLVRDGDRIRTCINAVAAHHLAVRSHHRIRVRERIRTSITDFADLHLAIRSRGLVVTTSVTLYSHETETKQSFQHRQTGRIPPNRLLLSEAY